MADGIHELDEFLLDALDEEIPGFKTPDFKDVSNEWLIDKFGVLNDRRKRLAKMEKIVRGLLLQRGAKTDDRGNQFTLVITEGGSARLDQEKVRDFVGADKFEDLKSFIPSTTVRVKPL